MSKKHPLVSIIIATYDPLRTLPGCLQSIQDQTYQNIEIIVVDALRYDPSRQKQTKALSKRFSAQYCKAGPERSIQRNRGIEAAKGVYLLVIDQDMYLQPTVVEECVFQMEHEKYVALLIPEISIGTGYWTEVVSLERYVTTYLETSLNECVRFFRKSDAERVGGFDPDIVGAEDSDFHYKIHQLGSIGKITSHIQHDEGKVDFLKRVQKKYYYSRAFHKYLQRYPQIAVRQFFPIKGAYFRQWKTLLSRPHILCGMILLRGAEVLAGAAGVLKETYGR